MVAASSAARPVSVIFDVGNVLVDWDPRRLYARHIPDPARLDRFLGEVATLEWHTQHDLGRPFAETSAELIERFPQDAAHIRLWGEAFDEQIGDVLPGMRALVEALAARGVPLFAITNFSHEFWPALAEREWPLLRHFKDILVSGEVKLVKPDPAIYALALDRFGLAAGAALFVDDRAENVAAAEAAGLAGHVFHGADRLERTLREYCLL